MTEPTGSSRNRTGLLVSFSLIALVFFYLISFGPILYLVTKTGVEHQTWFHYSIRPLYTPHLWCMTRNESYYDYGWWWHSLAKPGASKPAWEEWKAAH